MVSLCLKDGECPKDPRYSALHGSWVNLPPLYVTVGSTERLYDDSVKAVEKVKEAGGSVVLEVHPYACHIFPTFCMVMPEAMESLGRIGQFVAKSFEKAKREERERECKVHHDATADIQKLASSTPMIAPIIAPLIAPMSPVRYGVDGV